MLCGKPAAFTCRKAVRTRLLCESLKINETWTALVEFIFLECKNILYYDTMGDSELGCLHT